MTKGEKTLYTVSFMFWFKEKYSIEDDANFLLNSISIHSLKSDDNSGEPAYVDKKVDFDIRVINGKKAIYPLADAPAYIGLVDKLENMYKLKIKAEDYCKATKEKGNYTFYMKDDKRSD